MEVGRLTVERVRRGWQEVGLARSYRVMLDGTVVGRVGRRTPLTVELAPGHHELHLRIDWMRSRSVQFDAGDGEEVRVRCWPNTNALTRLSSAVLRPGDHIAVELASRSAC